MNAVPPNDIENLKAEVRKLNARATQAKMDLHDLSEELPTNWERIRSRAGRAPGACRPGGSTPAPGHPAAHLNRSAP